VRSRHRGTADRVGRGVTGVPGGGDVADGLAERAQRLLEEYHDLLPVTSELSLVLGSLAAAGGEWDRASGHLEHTGIREPENAVTPVVIAAHSEMVRLLMAKGDLPGAAAEADRGLWLLRRKGVWAWAAPLAPIAVDAFFRSARVPEARALTQELASGIEGRDAPCAYAALTLCRGLLAAEDGGNPRGEGGAGTATSCRHANATSPGSSLTAGPTGRSRKCSSCPDGRSSNDVRRCPGCRPRPSFRPARRVVL
jgi:hypothetical protein